MFLAVSIIAIVITSVLILLILFEPGLAYDLQPPDDPMASEEFLCLVGALADAEVHRDSRLQVLRNGEQFYEAELAAIAAARRSINLEAYIFLNDHIGRRFIDTLTERARAGVKVNVVVDAVGSFLTTNRAFQPLTDAGGRVRWYQPLRWYTLKRLNNRTHRELLVIDGETGFIGGAGIGDNWMTGSAKDPQWRDTVVRVAGDLVIGLQTTFAENWLEAADEVLTGKDYFPSCMNMSADDAETSADEECGLVVISSPSAGRSSRARVLFQLLLASARKSIRINSPYFLPDRSVQRELIKAVKRGVDVQVITPGPHSDHLLTRRASRRRYGNLLQHGVLISEYQPSMIHAKVLMIDDVWSVVGSTNFDNRSFGLNDEVNLAVQSPNLTKTLHAQFAEDLKASKVITFEAWSRRPIYERIGESVGRLIERQQ